MRKNSATRFSRIISGSPSAESLLSRAGSKRSEHCLVKSGDNTNGQISLPSTHASAMLGLELLTPDLQGSVFKMTLAPLVNAPSLIQIHAFAAIGACALGAVQIFAPKGTIPHRFVGWTWILLMATMIVTAFLNHDLVTWDPFSPKICCRASEACDRGSWRCASIHMVSLFTLLILPFAVLQARLNNISRHREAMIGLFLLLVIGGAFTFLPPRIMHDVVFGSPDAERQKADAAINPGLIVRARLAP